MPMSFNPYRPQEPWQFQGIRPTTTDWGPKDVSKQLQEGLGSLYSNYRKAYQEKYQSDIGETALKEQLTPGQQAASLQGPGGPYSTGSVGTPAALAASTGGGGSVNPRSIPSFTALPNKGVSAELQPLFENNEKQYNLPPGTLGSLAFIESKFNPNAKNPNSSAGGLFQFIDKTAKGYGLTNKFDPAESTGAAARLAADNAATLQRVLGRQPTVGELYLAHQQGGPGAVKLLANPNARAVDIVGPAAVRLNGGNMNMSAGEFANIWKNKADSVHSRLYGGGGNAAPQAAPSAAPQVDPNTLANAQAILEQPNSTPQMKEWAQGIVGQQVPPQGQAPATPGGQRRMTMPEYQEFLKRNNGQPIGLSPDVLPLEIINQPSLPNPDLDINNPRYKDMRMGGQGQGPGMQMPPGTDGAPPQQQPQAQPQQAPNPTPVTQSSQPLFAPPGNVPAVGTPSATPQGPQSPDQPAMSGTGTVATNPQVQPQQQPQQTPIAPIQTMTTAGSPVLNQPGMVMPPGTEGPAPPPPQPQPQPQPQATPPVQPPQPLPGGGAPPTPPSQAAGGVAPPQDPATTGGLGGRGGYAPAGAGLSDRHRRMLALAAASGNPNLLESAKTIVAAEGGGGKKYSYTEVGGQLYQVDPSGQEPPRVVAGGNKPETKEAGGVIYERDPQSGKWNAVAGAGSDKAPTTIDLPGGNKAQWDKNSQSWVPVNVAGGIAATPKGDVILGKADESNPELMKQRREAGIPDTEKRAVKVRTTESGYKQIDPLDERESKTFEYARNVANDLEANQTFKEFRAMHSAVNSLDVSLKQGNAAGDFYGTMQIFKAIDPTSTVSKGESDQIQASGGKDAFLQYWANKINVNNGTLTPQMRAEFLNGAKDILRARSGQALQFYEGKKRQAKSLGLNDDEVDVATNSYRPPDFKAPRHKKTDEDMLNAEDRVGGSLQKAKPVASEAEGDALPEGTYYTVNGKPGRSDGSKGKR